MQCYVYRSSRKPDTYIYLPEKDAFDDIPEALMRVFGEPEFALEFELTPDRSLAQENPGGTGKPQGARLPSADAAGERRAALAGLIAHVISNLVQTGDKLVLEQGVQVQFFQRLFHAHHPLVPFPFTDGKGQMPPPQHRVPVFLDIELGPAQPA